MKHTNAHPLLPYIPNTLTVLRLIGAPLVIWQINQNRLTIAFWLFFIICITDWFDGYLARRWQVTSRFGQLLDPIADKVLILWVYMAFALWELIPFWLMLLVLGRDAMILGIGSLVLRKENAHHIKTTSLAPKYIGKICAALQMLLIGLILGRYAFSPPLGPSSIDHPLMVFFFYSVAFVTILSGLAYAQTALKAWHQQ